MLNRVFHQTVKVASDPLTPYIASIAVGAVLTGAIALAAISSARKPALVSAKAEINIPADATIDKRWDNNPDYALKFGLEQSHVQLLLRLNLYRRNVGAREVARYSAMAATLPTNPTAVRCYRKSQQICLDSFADNITEQLKTAESNQEWLAGLEAAIALANAQAGIQLPASTTPDRFKILATIENWQNQLGIYYANSEAKARDQIENQPTQRYTETPQQPTNDGGNQQ